MVACKILIICLLLDFLIMLYHDCIMSVLDVSHLLFKNDLSHSIMQAVCKHSDTCQGHSVVFGCHTSSGRKGEHSCCHRLTFYWNQCKKLEDLLRTSMFDVVKLNDTDNLITHELLPFAEEKNYLCIILIIQDAREWLLLGLGQKIFNTLCFTFSKTHPIHRDINIFLYFLNSTRIVLMYCKVG